MSDVEFVAERRKMIEEHKTLLTRLNDFCFGNGSKGAKTRLQELEDIANGKEDSASMKKVNDHLDWHEKMSGRRWELYVGFILVIIAQILATIFLGGK